MSAGASPQTPLGELTAPPDLLARFKEPTSKGRKLPWQPKPGKKIAHILVL